MEDCILCHNGVTMSIYLGNYILDVLTKGTYTVNDRSANLPDIERLCVRPKSRRRIDISTEAMERLPSLEALGVRPEILEAAAEILVWSVPHGVEPDTIKDVLRLVVHHVLSDALPYRA